MSNTGFCKTSPPILGLFIYDLPFNVANQSNREIGCQEKDDKLNSIKLQKFFFIKTTVKII